MDRIKEIIVEELKGEDRIEMDSYVFAIANCETAFDNIQFDYDADKTTIGKIKSEHLEQIWDEVYRSLIFSAVDLLYSLMDGNEVYHD